MAKFPRSSVSLLLVLAAVLGAAALACNAPAAPPSAPDTTQTASGDVSPTPAPSSTTTADTQTASGDVPPTPSSPTTVDTPTTSGDVPPTPVPSPLATTETEIGLTPADQFTIEEYEVPGGSRPHDVAPAPDGTVWYTAQGSGALGRLDPASGSSMHFPLGENSAPHGVIVGPDGAAWVTDSGLNAIVRVDPATNEVRTFPLPADRGNANLNTATFDAGGTLWFTGQNGIYGRLNPSTGAMQVYDAPKGRGPYGISTTPDGNVYYSSLAGSYLGHIDLDTGAVTALELPTANAGARRVWADSKGVLWVSEWNAGQVARYDPATGEWEEWKLPGDRPRAYAVYVDEEDGVWLTDFGGNAITRFNPTTEQFDVFTLPSDRASVRQLLGRPGEIWGAESARDKLVVIRKK